MIEAGLPEADSEVEILAADVGGTFTDVIIAHAGVTAAIKIPSTRPAYEEAILDAATSLAGSKRIRRLAHGTTVATNALLEGTGLGAALITTEGFRDVLELARLRRPSLFDLRFVKPEPLVPRYLRFEVQERTAADGTVLVAPSDESVALLADKIAATGVQAVAVCLINSHANPLNERRLKELLSAALEKLGHASILVVSSDIQREIREFERTSTAVINAHVAPAVAHYLDRLQAKVKALHGTDWVQIMQSSGSLIPSSVASQFPCRLIESGPAAGVLAAAVEVSDVNDGNAIAFDMGGTTAKAALIEGGEPFETLQLEVGQGMNQDGGSMSGSGYVIRVPSLDISEVGAGGGSVVWLDSTGAPRVGPRSAGADPGPVCYGKGGTEPTVTDANIVLGFLSPDAIAGGLVGVDRDLAVSAISSRIAEPLGLDVATAAWGVHILANAGMEAAVRAVSTERGRAPGGYVLAAYGGAGPMHAATLATSFGIRTVLVPPRPGLLCAKGLMLAPIRYDVVRAYPVGAPISAEVLLGLVGESKQVLDESLSLEAPPGGDVTYRWRLAVRYVGQPTELLVPLKPEADLVTDMDIAALFAERFMAEHQRTYGYADAHADMEVVSVRGSLVAQVEPSVPVDRAESLDWRSDGTAPSGVVTERQAFFGPEHGWVNTPVCRDRRQVPNRGPAIIEEDDATTVVPPGWQAECDTRGRLFLTSAAS